MAKLGKRTKAIRAKVDSEKQYELKVKEFSPLNVSKQEISKLLNQLINDPSIDVIFAAGIIKKRPEVVEKPEGDSIEIRSMMYLSLSFDHRIVDGNLAGSFLRRIGSISGLAGCSRMPFASIKNFLSVTCSPLIKATTD